MSSFLYDSCAAVGAQEYPPLPKQAPWPSAPQPPAVDWDALIAEVVERGKDVPEVDWAIPGEDAAEEVRHEQAEWKSICVCLGRAAVGHFDYTLSVRGLLHPVLCGGCYAGVVTVAESRVSAAVFL